jgi:hypothetical protein
LTVWQDCVFCFVLLFCGFDGYEQYGRRSGFA